MLNVLDYGAVGDGQADDTAAIQAALKAAGKAHTLYMPGGTYRITAPLSLAARRVCGEHFWRVSSGGTVIRYEGPTTDAVVSVVSNAAQLESVCIDANRLAVHAVELTSAHGPACSVINITCTNALGAGIKATQCAGAVFDRVVSHQNDGPGFLLLGCNGASLTRFQASQCKGPGVEAVGNFAEDTWSSSGLRVCGGILQSNQGHGVWLRGVGGMMEVSGLYIERDQQVGVEADGVRLSDTINAYVARVGVSGTDALSAAYRLEGNTRNVVLDVCAAGGSDEFSRIQHDSPLGNGNTFRDCRRTSHTVSWSLPVYDASGNEVQQ